MRERIIEEYLVAKVKQLGGEVRKVVWVARNSAPDRLVMLPGKPSSQGYQPRQGGVTIWVELKASGGKLKFPCDARERAQQREHLRMRAMGQRVEIIDSIEGVDELLEVRRPTVVLL
jgi:hypothetical protein